MNEFISEWPCPEISNHLSLFICVLVNSPCAQPVLVMRCWSVAGTDQVKITMNHRTLEWLYCDFNGSERHISPAVSPGSLSTITWALNTWVTWLITIVWFFFKVLQHFFFPENLYHKNMTTKSHSTKKTWHGKYYIRITNNNTITHHFNPLRTNAHLQSTA